MKNPAPIAVTLGEPAGIGPDIIVMMAQRTYDFPWLVLGDPHVLIERARRLNLPLKVHETIPQVTVPSASGQLYVENHFVKKTVFPGRTDPENAAFVVNCLEAAIAGCLCGHFSAMVTAPIHKHTISERYPGFTGHTEFLAEKTNTSDVVMMLAGEGMKVALATTHVPLSKVSGLINREMLTRKLSVLYQDLKMRFGIPHPRILVSGLNPHAGEQGDLGDEEIKVISPVIKELTQQGWNIKGPLPADTLFTPSRLKEADGVMCMYHDQGLPVLKYASFGHAVNITLGLPFIRTSVDHGTALDIAGQGSANPGSLIAAFHMAVKLIQSSNP